VSTLTTEHFTCSDVIEKHVKEADIALYEAKNNGRSRTEFFGDINFN
jgi:PleD family two-component response regulator